MIQAMNCFREMEKSGLAPDAKTYKLLMVAHARVDLPYQLILGGRCEHCFRIVQQTERKELGYEYSNIQLHVVHVFGSLWVTILQKALQIV